MSYDKKESLVQHGDWDERSDSHPAMKFMHEYTNHFDANTSKDAMWDEGWVAKDFKFTKADGSTYSPGRESWDAVRGTYAFFTKWYHEPYFFTCWELDDGTGWAMTGNAMTYCNLPGSEAEGGVKDGQGRSWQMTVPAGFYFVYKKDESGKDGIRLAQMDITSDSGPIVVELLKRGVLKSSDLGL